MRLGDIDGFQLDCVEEENIPARRGNVSSRRRSVRRRREGIRQSFLRKGISEIAILRRG